MTAPKRKDPLIEHCRSLPGATEDVKWGKDLIFSVGGKMFAGFQLPEGEPLAFKVEPAVFDSLTAREGVIPAPYMAKHSWISVTSRKRLPATKLKGLLTDAHRLTAEKLSAKMKKSLGLAALAFVLLLTPDVHAESADVTAVKDVQTRQADAWNRHDAPAYAALFTDDGDVVNVLGWRWRGRAEIERQLTQAFEVVFRDSRLTITDVDVKLLAPGVAAAYVRWTMEGAKAPPGAPEPPREGIQLQVLQRTGDAWKIVRFQNTNTLPQRPFPGKGD